MPTGIVNVEKNVRIKHGVEVKECDNFIGWEMSSSGAHAPPPYFRCNGTFNSSTLSGSLSTIKETRSGGPARINQW